MTLNLAGFALFVEQVTAGAGWQFEIGTKLASEVRKKIEKFYLEKYTLSKNIVQYFRKMGQNSL